ncbi:hypothetical protein JAAARDRAFT_135955, partial [Jaapia argillacea MUCL 33604]
ITMDNASNCDTMMARLEELFQAENIPFDRDGNRIRQIREYADALSLDPIGGIRTAVGALHKSGQRRCDLRDVIIEGNKSAEKTWPDKVDFIQPLQLLRDVDTRWSSTFQMMGRYLYLLLGIDLFCAHPRREELVEHRISETTHGVLQDIHQVLEVPHTTQELLSGDHSPTASRALPVYERLIVTWRRFQELIPELAHYIGVGIAKLEEYVVKGRRSQIYALAMLINPSYKMEWVSTHWTSEDAIQAKEWLRGAMLSYQHEKRKLSTAPALHRKNTMPILNIVDRALRAQAHGADHLDGLLHVQRCSSSVATASSSHSNTPAPDPSPMSTPHEMTDAEKAAQEAEELASDLRVVDEELRRYLEHGTLQGAERDISLVKFWESKVFIYPLLYRVALDVLPVQASAVPCERIFSSARETTTVRQNKLNPALLKVLQILKFLYKQERLDFTSDWIANPDDYATEGKLTSAAIRELLDAGKLTELR